MSRVLRAVVAPVLLVAAVAAAFDPAYPREVLVEAGVVATLAGVLVGWLAFGLLPAVRARVLARRDRSGGAVAVLSAVLAAVVVVGGFAAVVARVGGRGATPAAVADAFGTFLLVRLPAEGLGWLGTVAAVVLYPTAVATTWASVRRRTLATLAAPAAGLLAAGLLVAPSTTEWAVPALLVAVGALVLRLDVRDDLASLPPLVGSNTELRRGTAWWRPLAQVGPAVLAVAAVVAVVPLPARFDVRRFVEPDEVRVEDPNPLAVAARWRELEEPAAALRVEVEGVTPGRLRLAVLDDYAGTGWVQSAAFAVTGDRLAPDPVFPDPLPGAEQEASTVAVTPRAGLAPFRALPTAGVPRAVTDPDGVRFAPSPGILLAEHRRAPRTYRSAPAPLDRPELDAPAASGLPERLTACPDSEAARLVAGQLAEGTDSALQRLDRIESWLLTRRIYDPSAPGGQTLAAVERFLEQPFARGNLEVFVTTYAVVARCAGVPTRVVVGFPAPAPGRTELDRGDVAVWVETPIADAGWVPVDPVPTPEEQERLAELAEEPPPPDPPEDEPDEVEPVVVEPQSAGDDGSIAPFVAAGAASLALLAVLAAAVLRAPGRLRRRRRRAADPTGAVHAAWASLCDALVDRGIELSPSHTPGEVVRLTAGRLPVGVPWLIAGLGPIVDRARYAGTGADDADAGLAWAYADAIEERLPADRRARLVALAHPARFWHRWRTAQAVGRRDHPWTGELPEGAVLELSEAPDDIPEVDVEARIGEGSTGTVYRAVHRPTGAAVAAKVFRYGPADPGFDQQRFEWEVRIAQGVSGLPHLPEVVAAGITPVSGRPYLVSTLYEQGTLLDRVRRGGPMTTAEAVGIGVDLAVALDALHQLGVVHADVKPENVFAGPRGWVLGDLGSAWLRAAHGPAATLTPPYAAPEVWRGSSPTPSSDLYSLALTMLFAATGTVPVAGNPPSLDEVEAAFPGLAVVARALDPDARRRPRGAAELARRLRPDLGPTPAIRVHTLSLPTPTVSRSAT